MPVEIISYYTEIGSDSELCRAVNIFRMSLNHDNFR